MFNYDRITAFKSIKTPFYFYDMELLNDNLIILKEKAEKYNVNIHYALKANANTPILEKISSFGFGADCVSGNEVKKAIETGFNPDEIFFAGVGKTDEEITYALKHEIGCLNVESLHELEIIDKIARGLSKKAPVALRINPDVDGHTKPGITTGTKPDKFGIDKDEITKAIELLKSMSHIEFKGLHFHIGSQITEMEVFKTLTTEANKIQDTFINSGLFPEILDMGGGLGVDYNAPDENPIPDWESYFKTFVENLDIKEGQKLHFEPGRAIVAQCGTLITSVLYLKNNGNNNFVIVDAGMNNLIRPALYNSKHKVQNLTGMGKETEYNIAGPICESSDIFAKNTYLPEIKRGDLLSIRTAGAYGEVMSSGYNLREYASAIYSNDFKNLKLEVTNG